ncbi:DUF3105 domain-containing protein [Cellulomonas sp.]|uniref:DUF3105 domain-containing protein n=1 Tax=Cellulomonas sp. TaxID=40001 RepID=UPI003BAB8E23
MSPDGKRSNDRAARKERLLQLQAAQRRAERRRTVLIVGIVAATLLALIIPTVVILTNEQRRNDAVEAVASAPIEGEQELPVSAATHVEGEVQYADVTQPTAEPTPALEDPAEQGRLLPPVGGDHDPLPQTCGFYSEPIRDENAVHSLEHGAVWIAYRPGLGDAGAERLRVLADANPYLLVSPYEGLAAPLVATAWGVRLELPSVDDARLEPFLTRYLQGEQAPEPGASCEGVGG